MEIKDILKQRQETHGDYSDGARFTQIYKAVFRSHQSWKQLTYSKKESIDMVTHKIARIVSGDHNWLDSWYDIIGYSQLILNQEEERVDTANYTPMPPLEKEQTKHLPLIKCLVVECIMSQLLTAITNPGATEPWTRVIECAQSVISDLESKGEKRVQR